MNEAQCETKDEQREGRMDAGKTERRRERKEKGDTAECLPFLSPQPSPVWGRPRCPLPAPRHRLTSSCFEENKVIYCQSIQHTQINYKV